MGPRLARQRPVVIQSMFPLFRDHEPNATELHDYCLRLRELVADGAQLARVQVYSATRPTRRSDCSHLSLRSLSQIARTVQAETGLPVEVLEAQRSSQT